MCRDNSCFVRVQIVQLWSNTALWRFGNRPSSEWVAADAVFLDLAAASLPPRWSGLHDDCHNPCATAEATQGDVGAPRPVRHAEKARTSTCSLADRVAETVVARYRTEAARLDEGAWIDDAASQTVVAGVVLMTQDGVLECVALGAGTRVVPDSVVETDVATGRVVADLHGEVLARRAFVAYVMHELEALRNRRQERESLIVAVPSSDEDGEALHRPRFRTDISIHFYSSSAPCGNACVRRWAKPPGDDIFDAELSPNEWPRRPHRLFRATHRAEGEVAVLCKVDPLADAPPTIATGGFPPPGTCLPDDAAASSRASCSDKLARWCSVGLEGSLVRSLVDSASRTLAPDTVTVGRKFCRPHLERAVCCRVGDRVTVGNTPRHPAIMCTSVKLHPGAYDAERGATFGSRALLWYRRDDCGGEVGAEIVDGLTGLLLFSREPCSVARCRLLEHWVRLHPPLPLNSSPSWTLMPFDLRWRAAKALAEESYRQRVDVLLDTVLERWPRRRARHAQSSVLVAAERQSDIVGYTGQPKRPHLDSR